jgi:hypothetical protein
MLLNKPRRNKLWGYDYCKRMGLRTERVEISHFKTLSYLGVSVGDAFLIMLSM